MSDGSIDEPEELLCPITQVMFQDPVVNKYGHTYERDALQRALAVQLRDPLTNLPLPHPDGGPVFANRAVRCQVADFLEHHPGYVPHGWVGRARSAPPDAQNEEEAAELQRMQAWAIRSSSPLQDFCVQVRRFIIGFIFRPRALLPRLAESPSKVAKVLGLCVGIWIGDELALLGAHLGWKLVVGMLRVALGDSAPLKGVGALLAKTIWTFVGGSLATLGFPRLGSGEDNKRHRRKFGLLFGNRLFGNKDAFLEGCASDIREIHDQTLLQELHRNVVTNGGVAAAVPEVPRMLTRQIALQSVVLKVLVHLACFHVDLAGIEIGYKTACLAYDSSGSALKAVASSSWACTRVGMIAGCSYALSALHVNAAIAVLFATFFRI